LWSFPLCIDFSRSAGFPFFVHPTSFGSFVVQSLLLLSFACPKEQCYFFVLTQKSNQKKSRLQIILGLLFFGLPTQYNSLSAKWRIAQTVLLTSGPRSKPQNSRFYPKFSEAF
jgi:hypothetical protein